MANEEHKELALFIKEVHSSLRKSTLLHGADKAWLEHSKKTYVLENYAHCMEKLATTYWEANSAKSSSDATSRIKWTADFCFEYFINNSYLKCREKDINIATKVYINLDVEENFVSPIKLIDVGSCYNPFREFDYFKVLPIDLYPANDTVYQCDFLKVSLGSKIIFNGVEVEQLQECFFDVVAFCFLLEYIPDSKLRIQACVKAYNLLKPGGLLIINTPDSKHVGANSKIIKCWRYTLACIGFSRIKYEKFKHMHCMAFRKSLHRDIAVRWAKLHKEPFMEYALNIPQDFYHNNDVENSIQKETNVTYYEFEELPFYDCIED
ncbi:unnamed protein product [Chilo suppressalis]|uniref:S-adenosylmethionine sensor upstream of mTORC1 n=1 Tax=Chilo suppressalis TaxID=168631 RepID=A0ABN8B2A3_CHISP|nr:unnamed protein product [Chilo suppressalis]